MKMRKTEINLNLSDVKEQTLVELFKMSPTNIVHIFVHDEEYDDTYKIQLMNTTKGIDIMCWLDSTPSFQADQMISIVSKLSLAQKINDIAGGSIC